MYKVFFEQYPLHDPRSDELQIRDADVHLAVGESGSMAFTIGNDHPNLGAIKRFNGVLRLTAGDVTIFKGRVRKDTQYFYLDRRIEAEGLLACLNDSVIPPFNFPEDFLEDAAYQTAAENGNVVQFFLEWVLALHNSQVGPQQKIQLGAVTVSDPNNYITRSASDFATSMEIVKKKLEELMGGYLVADYSGDITVLNYYADLPLTNIQEVEFAKNLLDLETELDATDTYTAILPVGKDGLTIADLPDEKVAPGVFKSGNIIYSESAEAAAGGRITKKVDWQDVTEATNLRRKAADMLTMEGIQHVQTITAKAVDLGGTDILPHFVVGRYVKLKSPPHGYAEAYPLMELEPNIHNPGDTEITLGSTIRSMTELNNTSQSSTREQIGSVRVDLNDRINGMMDGMVTHIKYSDDMQTFTGTALSSDVTNWEQGLIPAHGTIDTQPQANSFPLCAAYREPIPVRPGERYKGATGHESLNLYVREYDADGKYVSYFVFSKYNRPEHVVSDGVYYWRVGLDGSSLYSNFDEISAAFEAGEINPYLQNPEKQPGDIPGRYIGTLVDDKMEASLVFSDYTWKAFSGTIDESLAALQKTVTEQYTKIITDTQSIIMGALESYVLTGDHEEFKKTVESSMTLLKDEFSLKFTETSEYIENVDGDLQNTREVLTKHFDFTLEDGLEIKAGQNTLSLRLDNDLISFQKNGQQFGWWDGVDFHTGNIVIDVTKRAQLGDFAFVPRSNGSLDFLKVGG